LASVVETEVIRECLAVLNIQFVHRQMKVCAAG
jgi:hypothetical protein